VTSEEKVIDSPTGWVAAHIRRYVESGGTDTDFHGRPSLLLTTRGRKSGQLRRTAVFCGRDGDRYVVVASVGGAAHHPAWYLNLVANPEVDVQVGPERFKARARTATPEEKPALWRMMTAMYPAYDEYQAATTRVIPVVVLERI
jgi:deazaflavin-dependent oxidoreductase (nitroreductase family)